MDSNNAEEVSRTGAGGKEYDTCPVCDGWMAKGTFESAGGPYCDALEEEVRRLRAVLGAASALYGSLHGYGWFGPLWDELRAAIEAAQGGQAQT